MVAILTCLHDSNGVGIMVVKVLVLVWVGLALRWAAGEAGWKSVEIHKIRPNERGHHAMIMREKVSRQNREHSRVPSK